VPSESAAAAARDWAYIAAEKIVVIPNAVDVRSYQCDAAASGACQRKNSPFRVGFIGRLDPVKRVVDLVRAAAVLGERATVDIYGEGPDRPAIQREIDSSGVGRLVRLHGVISGPREALGKLDALVLPSDAEGFGLVLIEAMASGVAVVASDVAGIRDVVSDGVNGLLVPPRNPLVLAAAIVRLIDDEPLRRRLIAGGTAAVNERYDWSVVLPRYRQLLF
jgi:2-deoxystreptamine N-acetyl-D-glucosaminyltransferase/2-deoxystreptamine glucosyltransferase